MPGSPYLFQSGASSNFDSLAPTTTKGDVIVHNGTTNIRVAVGSNGQVLTADSTQASGLKYAAVGTAVVRSVTTTDGCTNADDILLLSGASFTETLFTAVGNQGKIITLVHAGTSISQAYTMATTSGQTVGGIASGSYVLNTAGETLRLVSDNANWIILDHKTSTNWVSYSGSISYTGMGTASTQLAVWRREGCDMLVNIAMTSGTPTGVEARMSIPATTQSSSQLPTLSIAGPLIGCASLSTNVYNFVPLIEPGVAYMTFGRQVQTGSQALLIKINGNAASTPFVNTVPLTITARFPIATWQP